MEDIVELGLINDSWDMVPRHSVTLPFFKALQLLDTFWVGALGSFHVSVGLEPGAAFGPA